MSVKFYHVSCADNNDSIMKKGLIPGEGIGYEEKKSEYVFLAKKKPSKNIRNFLPSANLLEDYLLQMSTNHATCPVYNLYEINGDDIDVSLIHKTNEKREIAYKGVINPRNIVLLQTYNATDLDKKYRVLNPKNWSR